MKFDFGKMGCIPIDTTPGAGAFKVMSDLYIERDREKWRLRANKGRLKPYIGKIKGQRFNNCAVAAAVKALEMSRAIANHPFIELSDTFTYQLVNGGRDAGSSIQSNLTALRNVGTVPATIYPGSTWRRRHTQEELELAENYQVEDYLELPDFDAHATSILWYHRPVCFGVRWGAAGHAIVGWDIVFRDQVPAVHLKAYESYARALEELGLASEALAAVKAIDDDAWTAIANSWTEAWGEEGLGYLPESQVASGIEARFGAWASLNATYAD